MDELKIRGVVAFGPLRVQLGEEGISVQWDNNPHQGPPPSRGSSMVAELRAQRDKLLEELADLDAEIRNLGEPQ